MANSRVSTRALMGIKERIMSGEWPAAYPLNQREIADMFGTSVIPIRDALQRLVGEGLVEARAGGGFLVPVHSGGTVRHLYQWHHDLVGLALPYWRGRSAVRVWVEHARGRALVVAPARDEIGQGKGGELARALAQAGGLSREGRESSPACARKQHHGVRRGSRQRGEWVQYGNARCVRHLH